MSADFVISATDVRTEPPIGELATTETKPWTFDVSARVSPVEGGVAANPVVKVTDASGADVTEVALAGEASVDGETSVITQSFAGASLSVGNTYLAVITFDIAEGDTQSAELEIRVPF